MKRNGLRALGLVSCVVALFSLLSVAVDLDGIVADELIAEISIAAGMNLVDQYIADYTAVELEALAATAGLTPGQAAAVNGALSKLGGFEALIALDNDALLALAVDSQEAANAYAFNNRSSYVKPELLEAVIAADDTLENVAIAFGTILGGFYGPGSPVGMKTEAELLVLVVEGEYLGLRVAAATGLTTYWILGSELTYVDVQNEILGAMLVTPELALAYQGYLAYLYSL